MSAVNINRYNVGRIAERIVSNELESRGFRVSDLNKEGTSTNADLLAAKDGRTWQIQVKGATEGGSGWWVNYGFCAQAAIDRLKPMYNSVKSFYRAQVVVLVSVRAADEYRCVVLPVEEAEKAAQLNLDHSFRTPKKDGSKKKPGKVWTHIEYSPKVRDLSRIPMLQAEREIITKYFDNWDLEKM
ncbi:MAG: hypothetical protein M1568_01520 [Acidobacteria bacterium]|jgi:hypothetical protein|nr:hypothetical protein [Acidobacteriota bacterium]